MNDKKVQKRALARYVRERESEGFCYFIQSEIISLLGYAERSFQRAVKNLIKQKRVLSIKPGFFIIVPPAYDTQGSLPPIAFIEPLMAYLGLSYYIGLRSAAVLYGAGGPVDEPLQVMISSTLGGVHKRAVHIRFLRNGKTTKAPVNILNIEAGMLRVSTPEATALDLVKFYKSLKNFSQVATVLAGFVAQLRADVLLETATKGLYDWAVIQRLGYLLSLEDVGGKALAELLAEAINEAKPRYVLLVPRKTHREDERDLHWRIFMNESIVLSQ
jgi:hypothetical protein